MKKRLNITIDEKLVSRRTGLPEGMSLVEYMQSLPKSKIDFPEDFDWKEEYYKAKAKKWGYEDLL
ncbi:MAG: hypothetical protein ACQEW9_08495 [Bacteroidota bacterium]